MKKILLILSLLVGLNSFAQDDFFWSYSQANQAYDTIFITRGNDFTLARFRTYSGDSLIITSIFGTIKVPSTGVNTTATNGASGTLCKIITKNNDLYDFELLNGAGSSAINTDQSRLIKKIEFTDALIIPNFDKNKALENLYINSSITGTSSIDFSANNLLKTLTVNYEFITQISITDNPKLTSINTAYCDQLTTINLGSPNFNVVYFYGVNCKYNQANIDKILKWLVDGGNSPNITGTAASVSLCGGTNATPSSLGMTYVSTLTSRGWTVCVNTNATAPTVQTNQVTEISSNHALGNGAVINQGSANVTARGSCISTTVNPTIAGTRTIDGSGIGSFTSYFSGLSPTTLYHVRAYATNSVGTAYGENVTFTTLATPQTVPVLTTNAPTNISQTTATSGGVISSDGAYPIVEKGVCWNTTGSPNYNDTKTNDGTGTASFTSSITGLSASTTYYLKSYARNRFYNGSFYIYATGYGQEEIFTTAANATCNLPTLSTYSVNSITPTTASGGGNVIVDGGCAVTLKGICWSTSPNPTTANPRTTDGSGTGAFSSTLTGLTCGLTYYIRAYATNSSGTAYGNQVTFLTQPNVLATGNKIQFPQNPPIYNPFQVLTGFTNGGCNLIERGVVWSTSPNPTILNNKYISPSVAEGDISESFNVTPGTYYFSGYAINNVGVSYYPYIYQLVVSGTVPIFDNWTAISSVGSTSFTFDTAITSDGGSAVTERGVVVATTSTPTTANTKVSSGSGIGSYSVSITGLTANTKYYYRGYAINSIGTAYTSTGNFTTNP